MGEETPRVLAKLPRPLFGNISQIRWGPCHRLRKGRKRKRIEIAVGIDGEALNIYDVSHSLMDSEQNFLQC